jgi:hypothetical protein
MSILNFLKHFALECTCKKRKKKIPIFKFLLAMVIEHQITCDLTPSWLAIYLCHPNSRLKLRFVDASV